MVEDARGSHNIGLDFTLLMKNYDFALKKWFYQDLLVRAKKIR